MDWRSTIVAISARAAAAITPLLGTAGAGRLLGTGAGGDQTMHVDQVAENLILEGLAATGHRVEVITEERGELVLNGDVDPGPVPWRAIIDPVDGSFNASRGLPLVAVSIALAAGPSMADITHAAVASVPTGGTFSASRGEGAWLGERRLVLPSTPRSLDECVLGVDLNPKHRDRSRAVVMNARARLLDIPRKIRVLGSNALATCHVASGGLDAFVDLSGDLRLLDIAAGCLITREAGGDVQVLGDRGLEPVDTLPLAVATRANVIVTAGPALTTAIAAAWSPRKTFKPAAVKH